MKKYVLTLGLILGLMPVYVNADNINANYVIKDGYSDFTVKNADDKTDLSCLDFAEEKILGKNFKTDSADIRLSRIEAKIFGAIQSGSFIKRMNMIYEYSNKCLISDIKNDKADCICSNFYGYGGFGNYRNNRRNGRFWNRRPYGTITGLTPPVNYGYNGYNGIYNNPNYYYRESLVDKIKKAFSKNKNLYSNNPLNPPLNANDPFLNGNYNNYPLNNKKSINLFENDGGISAGNIQNGFGYEGKNNSGGKSSVTILD